MWRINLIETEGIKILNVVKPVKLSDDTISYSKTVLYPKEIVEKIRTHVYKNNLENFSEGIFDILEEHKKMPLKGENFKLKKGITSYGMKKNSLRRTVRFREVYYDYVKSYADKENKSFSYVLIMILEESLKYMGE